MKNDKQAIDTQTAYVIDPHQWVKKHADYLYAFAITRVNDQEQARELVQDTFLAALERMDKFEARSSERTWLTAILKNKIIDVYRKRSSLAGKMEISMEVKQEPEFFYQEDGHWKEEHWPKPFGIETYDPLAAKEFQAVLKKCMQKLPSLWLSVFTMKHIDEEETHFICKELKVSPSNFWVIIHRAKVNLRSCLQQNWI